MGIQRKTDGIGESTERPLLYGISCKGRGSRNLRLPRPVLDVLASPKNATGTMQRRDRSSNSALQAFKGDLRIIVWTRTGFNLAPGGRRS